MAQVFPTVQSRLAIANATYQLHHFPHSESTQNERTKV